MSTALRLCGALMLTLLAALASANDSVAGFGIGGLELRTTESVAMLSEVLVISPEAVQVDYVFRNLSAAPVSALVAFPLPEVGLTSPDADIAFPLAGEDNYVGFETRIDGVAVALQTSHRVLLDGVDRSAEFAAIGLQPLASMDYWTLDTQRASWTNAQRIALETQGFLDAQGLPRWRLQTLFWREQVFAPQTDVRVSHRYRPVAAAAVDGWFPGFAAPEDGGDATSLALERAHQDARARFCVTEADEAAMRASLPPNGFFSGTQVDYILSTGANWRGPIGLFRLEVHSPEPGDFVFLCLPGARRIASNRILFDARDFTPRQDLAIYVSRRAGPP